jgi:hypothetical protein
MRQLFILMFLFMITTISVAKDIVIQVTNSNEIAVTVYFGAIGSKENYLSDQELVANREAKAIKSGGRPIKPGKTGQFGKKDLSGSDIIVIFGLFPGGGRTEVLRYRVKDIKAVLYVDFERVKITKSNSSYLNIAQALKSTNNLGASIPIGQHKITGTFMFFDINSTKFNDLVVAIPSFEFEFTKTKAADNSISDFLSREAAVPYMDSAGNLLNIKPSQTQKILKEVFIPGYEKVMASFGDNSYKYLTWNIISNYNKTAKNVNRSFFDLFNSCPEKDRQAILNNFNAQIKSDSIDLHLYFLETVQRADTVDIKDHILMRLGDTDQLLAGDLISPNANYRMTGEEKTIYFGINVVGDIKAIDVTLILYYLYAKLGKSDNSMLSATNFLEIYNSLNSFVELPELDDKAISISNPVYTISKIRELISDPKVQSKIEAKFTTGISGLNPVNALKVAITKFK